MIDNHCTPDTRDTEVEQLRCQVAALQQENHFLRGLIDHLPVMVFARTTDDGSFTLVNKAFEQTTGMSADDVLGMKDYAFFSPDQAAFFEQTDQFIMAGHEHHVTHEGYIERSDADHRLLRTVRFPLTNGGDKPYALIGMAEDITERAQSEQRLRASEERFRNMVLHANEIIYTLDTHGVFTFVSPTWTRLLGHEVDEVEGQPFTPLVHPDDLPACFEMLQRAMISGEPQRGVEYRVQHKDGTWRWHTSVGTPVKDEAGQPMYYVGVAQDITERKHLEQQLHVANARLNQALDTAPLATVEFDMQGIIRRWNASAERMFGWQFGEAIGQEVLTLVVPTLVSDPDMGFVESLVQQGEISVRNDVLTKDGHTMTCQWHNTVLRNEHGAPVGFLCQAEDITAMLWQEQELRGFQTLVEHAPDGILIANLDTRICYANDAYQQLVGYDAATLTQFYATDLLGAEEANLVPQIVAEIQAHGSWRGILSVMRVDGQEIAAQHTVFLTTDSTGQPHSFVLIVRDLTEQVQAEAERAALQQQVIDAQQAAIRELSTPLIPISDDVVIMPLIGSVDSQRAQQVMETLMDGIGTNKAQLAIIDITGVQVVDTQVADALIKTARAVRLLGAQVMLTGIQPQIAQTLVHLGVDLSGIITYANLQAGIAYALKQNMSGLKRVTRRSL